MLSRLALVAAALLLVPTAAFTEAGTSARTTSASVRSDADSYLKAVKADPTLGLGNAYTSTFLTLTHNGASGTTLDVTITKTAGAARFTVSPTSGTIASTGGTLSVAVTDTNPLHTPTSDTLTVRVDANVKNGGASVGSVSYSRSVTVTV